METIRHVIKFFLKIAAAFFALVIIWWFVSLLFPDLSFRTLVPIAKKGEVQQDWLPSPREYAKLFQKKSAPTAQTNLYVAPAPYNGYGDAVVGSTEYITYKGEGSVITKGKDGEVLVTNPTPQEGTTHAPTRSLFIRNLSVYEGGHIYRGLNFIGEARSTMYKNGRFAIVLVDATGHVIGVSVAIATTAWAVPGWTRFQSIINYGLPKNTPCTMVFEEALTQVERVRPPIRVPLRVMCG